MNVAGIYASKRTFKLGLLGEIASNRNTMIIAITESHLQDYVKDAEIKLSGYDIYRADRKHAIRGGVLVYVRSDLKLGVQVLHSDLQENIEMLILYLKKQETIFITIYRPPTAGMKTKKNCLI